MPYLACPICICEYSWWILSSRMRLRMAGFGIMTSSARTRPWPRARNEGLRENTLQHEGELGAHLGLGVRRKDVDDPVDGLDAAVGVQRGEAEVAGLGHGEGRLDG